MRNRQVEKKSARIYDLEERTTTFSKLVIQFSRTVPRNVITLSLISQFVRSGTSVGANYHEANGAISMADFRNKISICKKEIKETRYWIELLVEAEPRLAIDAERLIQESQELINIFSKIYASLKEKQL